MCEILVKEKFLRILEYLLNFLLFLALPLESENAACELYKAIPPTTFTRTLSNPEIVMKKRRERKIEAKLKGMGQGKVSDLQLS